MLPTGLSVRNPEGGGERIGDIGVLSGDAEVVDIMPVDLEVVFMGHKFVLNCLATFQTHLFHIADDSIQNFIWG